MTGGVSWGGRAVCPVEEYTDPAIREEMTWHALEQALLEFLDGVEWALLGMHDTRVQVAEHLRQFTVPVGGSMGCHLQRVRLHACWRARSDSHLGPDAAGLVDLTCTLTPA